MEEPPFTRKAKFEVYGEEMIEEEVKQSGNSGGALPDCANASFSPGFYQAAEKAKSRLRGRPKSLVGNAYMRSLPLYAATTKDKGNAADGHFSATY